MNSILIVKCNSNQKWDNDSCQCECKNPKENCVCEEGYFGNIQCVAVKIVNRQEVLLVIQ